MLNDPLGEALTKVSGRLFAVIDAAKRDYLQDELTLARLRFDPLYLDEIDAPSIASGPHLVTIRQDHDIAVVRSIIGDEAACVWWVWPDEPDAPEAMYRHLRGLNMVEIPRNRYDQKDEDAGGSLYEAVLLRHADPNVIISLLPVLYQNQVARLFGRSKAIIVDSPEYRSVRTFDAPPDLPSAQRGLLRIVDADQYERFGSASAEFARAECAEALREAYPEFVENIGEDAFQTLVSEAEQIGIELGFATENAHYQWAAIHLLTLGDLACQPDFWPRMRDYDGNIDAHIEEAFIGFHDELDKLTGVA